MKPTGEGRQVSQTRKSKGARCFLSHCWVLSRTYERFTSRSDQFEARKIAFADEAACASTAIIRLESVNVEPLQMYTDRVGDSITLCACLQLNLQALHTTRFTPLRLLVWLSQEPSNGPVGRTHILLAGQVSQSFVAETRQLVTKSVRASSLGVPSKPLLACCLSLLW